MGRYVLPDNLGSTLEAMDRSRRRFANGGPTEAATGESTAPSPVTNLAGTTGYYRDTVQGVDLAYVDLTWDLVVPVEDSSPSAGDGTDPAKAPVDHYAVRYRLGGSGNFTTSSNSKTNSARVSGLPPGNTVEFQVAAVTTTGTFSSWASLTVNLSIDAGAPNTPATLTVVGTYGGVKATWNGLDSSGGAMPNDFDHADFHASVTSGFTPSTSTKYVSVLGASTVTIPHPTSPDATTPVYVKLVAYDLSGNASAASAQASASPSTIVATSVADGSITETKIANNAVTTPKILANSIDASKIAALTITAGQIAAGAITSTKIAAGAITADLIGTGTLNATVLITAGSFANGSNRVEFDRNGVRLVRRSAGGVDTTVVDLNANTGNATVTGTLQTGTGGQYVKLDTVGGGGRAAFYSGDGTETQPGTLGAEVDGTYGVQSVLRSPEVSSFTSTRSTLKLYSKITTTGPNSGTVGSLAALTADDILITGETTVNGRRVLPELFTTSFSVPSGTSFDTATVTFNHTYTAAPNVFCQVLSGAGSAIGATVLVTAVTATTASLRLNLAANVGATTSFSVMVGVWKS